MLNSLLPSFIIFLYDFLIWNFSYSITHTSKNKLMQLYITFPSSGQRGRKPAQNNWKHQRDFPVWDQWQTQSARHASSCCLPRTTRQRCARRSEIHIQARENPSETAITEHFFLDILKNYVGINMKPGWQRWYEQKALFLLFIWGSSVLCQQFITNKMKSEFHWVKDRKRQTAFNNV